MSDDRRPTRTSPFGRSRLILAGLVLVALAGAGWWWLGRRSPARVPPLTAPAPPPTAAATPPDLRFTDVTAAAGISWQRDNGARGERLLPETMGGGGAFFDVDQDGDPDLLLVGAGTWDTPPASPPRPARRPGATTLLYNDGGHFREDTTGALASLDLYGMGVAIGDVDNDAWPDVLLTAVGDVRLLGNDRGTLRDRTATAGLAAAANDGSDPAWNTAATFFDADRDGDLDLVLARYVRWSRERDLAASYTLTGLGRAYGPPTQFAGTSLTFWRNQGDGSFRDESAASGMVVTNPATGVAVAKTLGLLPIDVDDDGWLDLFVANDTTQNFLLRNLGDGHFAEVGVASGLAFDRLGAATGAMGVDVSWPFAGDADPLLVVGNFANEMTSAYLRQPLTTGAAPAAAVATAPTGGAPGTETLATFADEAMALGLGAPTRGALTFGVLALDLDLDGRTDLVQTNGHLEPEIATVDPSQHYAQASQLFWNSGGTPRFVALEVAAVGALAVPLVGRGSAAADIDGDGDLDLVELQPAGAPRLLRNDQTTGHRWLRLELVGDPGRGCPRDAVGTLVEVRTGDHRQRQQVHANRGYLSASERILTFGLGTAERVDELTIRWCGADDEPTRLTAVAANQTLRLAQAAVASPGPGT